VEGGAGLRQAASVQRRRDRRPRAHGDDLLREVRQAVRLRVRPGRGPARHRPRDPHAHGAEPRAGAAGVSGGTRAQHQLRAADGVLPRHLPGRLGRGAVRGDDVDLVAFLHHRRAVRGLEALASGADLGLRHRAGRAEIPRSAGAYRRGGRDRLGQPLVPDDLPGGDRQGLRAYGARQGAGRVRGAVPPCAQERAHPDPHGSGGGNPAAVHGQSHHRVVLRHSRARQLHHRRHPGAGLRRGALDGIHRLGALHRGPHPDRACFQFCSRPTCWYGCW